jgi:hypothetical protein
MFPMRRAGGMTPGPDGEGFGPPFFVGPPNMPKEIMDIMVAAFKQSLNDPKFLAWAKMLEIPVAPVYGDDAEKMAKRIFKFYTVDMKPLLLKNLVQ